MAEKPTMPTPVAAELLLDHEGAEQDERHPDVHLLEVDEGGEAKTTAQRMPNGWRIAEWELTEELEGALGGARYWFCRSFFTVPAAHLHLLSMLETEHVNRTRASYADDLPF